MSDLVKTIFVYTEGKEVIKGHSSDNRNTPHSQIQIVGLLLLLFGINDSYHKSVHKTKIKSAFIKMSGKIS